MADIASLRRQFPFLEVPSASGNPYAYLDNAATTQKPLAVTDVMNAFYRSQNGAVHRGVHELSERATVAYESARSDIQRFIGAETPEEIVFTKNATEAVNLVAHAWGRTHLRPGDTVLLTLLEHHSNIVPWLQLKDAVGVGVEWIGLTDDCRLDERALLDRLSRGDVRLLAVTGQSNVLGVRPDLSSIIPAAHAAGATVLVDAAQLVAHERINVAALDADFLAFSGHKLYGPTGIGVLYGKRHLLGSMPPFLGGGMMIRDVFEDRFTPADVPQRFEAGSQPVAEVIGLGAAVRWLEALDRNALAHHERTLIDAAVETLRTVPGLRILGPGNAADVGGCVSFVIDGIHPHDLTEILGREGICLRAGHHCTQPLHRLLGINASSRLSVGVYNTVEEIRSVGPAIVRACSLLRR